MKRNDALLDAVEILLSCFYDEDDPGPPCTMVFSNGTWHFGAVSYPAMSALQALYVEFRKAKKEAGHAKS